MCLSQYLSIVSSQKYWSTFKGYVNVSNVMVGYVRATYVRYAIIGGKYIGLEILLYDK